MAALKHEMGRARLQATLRIAHRSRFIAAYLRPALKAGLIEMTLPNKPTSMNQRYRRTAAGEALAHAREQQTKGKATEIAEQVIEYGGGRVQSELKVEILVANLTREMGRAELQAALRLTHRQHFITAYLRPALEAGLVEMTLPDKPTSMNQRYRRTAAGAALMRSRAPRTRAMESSR